MPEVRRKTPEDFLRECQAEEPAHRKGHLKIVLGYASGVGKSFRILDEARRRRERGQDIVVGAIQRKVPLDVEAVLRKLEVIPLKQVDGGTAIDVDAILRRNPEVCVIDGLAYDNPPGLKNATRWQDVRELLDAGIKVIASINIQYICELRERVEAITHKLVKETVPVEFIRNADEIEISDAPADRQVAPLRELALVLAAEVVDRQLTAYLEAHHMPQRFGTQERILVCVTPRANMQQMMETAQTMAQRFHGELIVAYVQQAKVSAADQAALDTRLASAREAGAQVEILHGEDAGVALLEFARARAVTQIFVGHSQQTGLARWRTTPLDRLIWEGHGMDVHVFPQ